MSLHSFNGLSGIQGINGTVPMGGVSPTQFIDNNSIMGMGQPAYQMPMASMANVGNQTSPLVATNPVNAATGMGKPPASKGWFGVEGLGKNVGTLRLGIDALQTIGGLWNAYEQNKLANAQFNYQSGLFDTNLANQIRAYNTAVEDKYRSRGVMEGHSQEQVNSNIEQNKARDERKG